MPNITTNHAITYTNKELITKINKLWVNFLFPHFYCLKPGTPFKNLDRGRVNKDCASI